MPRRYECRFAPKGRLSRHSGLRFRSDRSSFAGSTAAFAFGTLRAGARTRARGKKSCRGDMGAALWENIGLPRRYVCRFAGMALGCGTKSCYGDMGGAKWGWGYKLRRFCVFIAVFRDFLYVFVKKCCEKAIKLPVWKNYS